MGQFQGHFYGKVDAKGRIVLPSGLKVSLSETSDFFMTNSLSQEKPCLDVYISSSWKKIVKQSESWDRWDPDVQLYKRFYLAAAQEMSLDSQNRIRIPSIFQDHLKLNKEVLIIGMGEKFEIWNPVHWDDLKSQMSVKFDQILKNLSNLQKPGSKA